MRGMSGVNKAGGLLTIDGLMKMPMKECVLDVELMNVPGVHRGNAEHNAYGGRLDHGAEGLIIVDVVLLREISNHPPSFVPGERDVRVELMEKDPLPRHHVCTCRTSN
jgi:hypothetical protein